MTAERITLSGGSSMSRLLKGGWQLAGGHGPVDRRRAIEDMGRFVDAGIDTFDCADIYTGVEALIGEYLATEGGGRPGIRVHTKYAPDWSVLPELGRDDVRATVLRSCERLGVDRLDMVQFHWWRYDVPGMERTGEWLCELASEGRIADLAGCNFDTGHLRRLVDAGFPAVTNQVQYSVLDRRPERTMVRYCAARDIGLICYGVLAGGFLSERWLGAPEPGEPFENRSLRKYKLVIDDWGGWTRFQRLLEALAEVAARRDVDIAAVATRWVLDRPSVAGAIVGARNAEHLPRNLAVFSLALDSTDLAAIDDACAGADGLAGEPFDLERDRDGRHGAIMRYELSAGPR